MKEDLGRRDELPDGFAVIVQLDHAAAVVTASSDLRHVEEGEDVAAPLPHLGLSYGYAFKPNLGFRAQGLAFAIKINDYEGTLLDLGLDFQYRPWRRLGVGAGMRYFNITIDDNRGSRLARFQYEYYGPVIYAVYSF